MTQLTSWPLEDTRLIVNSSLSCEEHSAFATCSCQACGRDRWPLCMVASQASQAETPGTKKRGHKGLEESPRWAELVCFTYTSRLAHHRAQANPSQSPGSHRTILQLKKETLPRLTTLSHQSNPVQNWYLHFLTPSPSGLPATASTK